MGLLHALSIVVLHLGLLESALRKYFIKAQPNVGPLDGGIHEKKDSENLGENNGV